MRSAAKFEKSRAREPAVYRREPATHEETIFRPLSGDHADGRRHAVVDDRNRRAFDAHGEAFDGPIDERFLARFDRLVVLQVESVRRQRRKLK